MIKLKDTPNSDEDTQGGNEKILFVDDEAPMVKVSKKEMKNNPLIDSVKIK